MRSKVMSALIIFLLASFSSCTVMRGTYQEKVNETQKLARSNAELEKERDSLKADLAGMTKQRDKAEADLAYVSGQLGRAAADRDETGRRVFRLERENERLARHAEAKEEQVEQVRKTSSTYEELLVKMKAEVEQGRVTIMELEGKLSVNLVDSILFDSGQDEVKKGGKDILAKVVPILKDAEDKIIRVEGHTDNARIAGSLVKRFPSNWELSAARALNVTRFLQREGIPGERLSAVAYGEWKPVAGNDTAQGRAQNRRIEITLVDKE